MTPAEADALLFGLGRSFEIAAGKVSLVGSGAAGRKRLRILQWNHFVPAFDPWVVNTMFAGAATGADSAEEAVSQADRKLRQIWEKWHARGLL